MNSRLTPAAVAVVEKRGELYRKPSECYKATFRIDLQRQRGFSLVELLIVVAILGILAAISIIGYKAVMGGTKESLVRDRLREVAEAQMQFRVSNGRGRYGTLAELRAARTSAGTPVLNSGVAPVDAGGNPAASQGWIVREPAGSPSGAALKSAFAVEAAPEDASVSGNTYCLFEDAVLRVATGGNACTRASTEVQR
jgi:prepilin-type N-terminal cleavage/methylation domain-containing protein